MHVSTSDFNKKVTLAGSLIAIGIVFAAFGLSVTLTMIASTILINFYLRSKRISWIFVTFITGLFLLIETSFLIANLQKIVQGGWITLAIGFILFMIMFVWWKGKKNQDCDYADGSDR